MEKLNAHGLVYHYQKAINPSKGTILFIHGFATTSEYHNPFAEQLKDYDYYALELPGHGFSDLNMELNELSPNKLAHVVIDWINKMNLNNFNLIGHSMGGGIVGIVASRIPDKIKKLVMVTPMNASFSFKLINIWKFVPNSYKKTYAMQKILYKDAAAHFELKENDPEIIRECEYQIKNRKTFKALRTKMASLQNLKILKKEHSNIKPNTLLLVGKYDDIIYWKSTLKFFNKFGNFQTYTFENSGHLPFIEEKELYFEKVINFIENEK